MEPKEGVVRVLFMANWLVAGVLLVMAVWTYAAVGSAVGLVILLAMVIVGPVEDLLEARFPGDDPHNRYMRQIVDQSTSLVMLILLVYAAYLAALYVGAAS